jgi:Tfp pilus assembly protein PilE
MLIRISLIVAIIAGLAVGALNFVIVKDKITTLQKHLADETSAKEQALHERDVAKKDFQQAKAALEATNQVLLATQTERDSAVTQAAAQTKRATQLADELTKTKKDRDDAQAELAAYRATGFSPGRVATLGKALKDAEDNLAAVQDENKVLGKRIEKLDYELAKYRGQAPTVRLPANLIGKILVSDPKWDFVVLDIGEDQGIKEDGELLVNRDGKLVAKVKVTSVQKNRCIANVLPGWKLGELLEGDQVIPAYPAS